MENETGKASFLGVGLTMIVAVIVLGLAVFAVARGIMNTAQSSFVQTMDGAANAGLSDFDGTTVSGVMVRSALEDYEGQNYMLLVNTAALQKKSTTDGKAVASDTFLEATAIKKSLVVREEYGTDNANLQLTAFGKRQYIVYNAQAADGNFSANTEGFIEYSGVFKTNADGMVQFNVQKINWKTSGCTEYISNSSNFTCKLIKDSSGTIVGILFTEVY